MVKVFGHLPAQFYFDNVRADVQSGSGFELDKEFVDD
jgi:hypothetical protein